MKAILILNADDLVPRWQFEALKSAIANGLQITGVIHCRSDNHRKVQLKNLAYYTLAVWCRIRGDMNKRVSISPLLHGNPQGEYFDSEWSGVWESIPASVSNNFGDAEVGIKFGMNLLKDPEQLPLKFGVLSYHHGDPENYRGRPAGFHELKNDEHVIGIIVQRLSNKLDGGDILARGFSKAYPHSYAKTLDRLLESGIPLLGKAILELENSKPNIQENQASGTNYTLPSNLNVLRALLKTGVNQMKRIAYGLTIEKKWRVAQLPGTIDPSMSLVIDSGQAHEIPLPIGFTFVADPCGGFDTDVYCEVMNYSTSLGQIARFHNGDWKILDLGMHVGHVSYPQTIEYEGKRFLFPEIASSSPPTLFELHDSGLGIGGTIRLKGLEHLRLIDGTLHLRNDTWFLFAGLVGNEDEQLRLWFSDELEGPYTEHPMSPVKVDPRGARMAGPLTSHAGREYRFGQDCSRTYGDGIISHRVEKLSKSEYLEKQVSIFSVAGARGPHTFRISPNGTWIDFFESRFSLLAWLPRVRRIISVT